MKGLYIFAALLVLTVLVMAFFMYKHKKDSAASDAAATAAGSPVVGSVVTGVTADGTTQISAPSSSAAATAAAAATASTVTSITKKVLPRLTTQPPDCGWGSNDRGWFDLQGFGVPNDYCRWVGGTGPGTPGSVFLCALAGAQTDETPNWHLPDTPPFITTPSGNKLWLDKSLAPSPLPAGDRVIDPADASRQPLAPGDICYPR